MKAWRNGGRRVETVVVEETGENAIKWSFDGGMNVGHPISFGGDDQ